MLRGIKYELKPTSIQKETIRRICGCCRFVYNTAIAKAFQMHESKERVSWEKILTELTDWKEQNPFLRKTPATSLENAIAQARKFSGRVAPIYKKKHSENDGYQSSHPCKLNFVNYTVHVAKLGDVKFYKGRNKPIHGKIQSYTINYNRFTERYYITILYESKRKKKPIPGKKTVGIDVGVRRLAALSDETILENQKYRTKSLWKIKLLQAALQRRYQEGKPLHEQSKNWFKARRQLAKLNEHIYAQNMDYLHKTTRMIADTYSTVFTESIDLGKFFHTKPFMVKHVRYCGWKQFFHMLETKSDELVKVNRSFPSSQLCSACGYRNLALRDFSIVEWDCPECGSHHDRDINAAKNIRREGLFLCGERSARQRMNPRDQQ